jgi:hypothetical protein
MEISERDAIMNEMDRLSIEAKATISKIKEDLEDERGKIIEPLLQYLRKQIPTAIEEKVEKQIHFGLKEEKGKIFLRANIEKQMVGFIGITILTLPLLSEDDLKLLNKSWSGYVSINLELRHLHVYVSPRLDKIKKDSLEILQNIQSSM